ncbi:hydrogenase expression/formation protein HypE [Thioalkalivibrio sp. ALE21]|uniref:hydrogenase expression/formation protein HypE n=1 Tax=Thioalkalivibrio sp. ALE21 TaxID=1158175 RepID=UPI000D8A2348|nr:hydrogenase expression/formation protein HypE [Thioalkalivibrio sp. ALE21]PYG03492.1 hydrogenase expression/formation protein HypE [Thioalkalivibrio sp. ALE21]
MTTEVVRLAHGGGGRLQAGLLDEVILPALGARACGAPDAAVLDAPGGRLAMTTDSFVVRPLFFPGGDIGRLAVHGTVNDLAMAGARPRWLTLGLILEEGLPLDDLRQILASVRTAAEACGVSLVAGDTKVVEAGHGDGVYINTTGAGIVPEGVRVDPATIRPGDVLLASGDLGRHGVAILAAREDLGLEPPVPSDSAAVAAAVAALLDAGVAVHALRDPTRGGAVAALQELADASGCRLVLEDEAIPVREDVRGACEILGLDPLHSACEGRFLAAVPEDHAGQALAILRSVPETRDAVAIGRAAAGDPAVIRRLATGVERRLVLPAGEQLPRIC